MKFSITFTSSAGEEVAGVWFDRERREWRVSTVPIKGFATKRKAIDFYKENCDQHTGLPFSPRTKPLL